MWSRIGRWLQNRRLEQAAQRAGRLRADLEQRGVPLALAGAVAEQLEPRAAALDPVAYQAVIETACAAWGAQRRAAGPETGAEIQRLVQDFAVELQKLDEGLQLLSTYLLRLRDRARSGEPAQLVHSRSPRLH